MKLGINIHTRQRGRDDKYAQMGPQRCVDLAKSLGFTSIRVACGHSATRVESPTQIDRLVVMMNAAKAAGLSVQIVFLLPYTSNRTDGGAFPDTPAGRYQQGRQLVTEVLLALPYMPEAIEIENEVTNACGMLYTEGQTLAEYNTAAFNGYADLMLGEYDAIRLIAPKTKIIVGTMNRNYAFIPWIMQKGINPDIVGYHLYERLGADLTRWQQRADEPPGAIFPNLLDALRSYGKPITINEFNGYQEPNNPAQVGATGLKTLQDILAMPAANVPVESAYCYELFESDNSRHGIYNIYNNGFEARKEWAGMLELIRTTKQD